MENWQVRRTLVRETSIVAVVAINLFILMRYCWLIWKERIKPALAMWVFFSIAVAGSLLTYLSAGDYSLLDNILNTSDLVLVVTVSVFIFIFGDRSTRFNRFDLGCLITVLATIYSLRAIISTSVLLALMVRAELKQRNDRESEPAL